MTEINAEAVIAELSQEIARLSVENAVLKVQIQAQGEDNAENDQL